MKNFISNFFTAFLLLLTLCNCEKFLTEDPRDVLSPENFYQSDDEVKAAVNGLYVPLYSETLYGKYGLNEILEYGADVIEPTREGGGNLNDICNYTLSEGRDSSGREVWIDLYKIIQDANVLISKLNGNENISKESKNQSLGEALYLRAFAYYNLTNIWGDVPYYREDLSIDEVQSLGRFNKTQIRDEIVEDLKLAQELLPSTYSESELGRASKWAAATLMAKIYLFQKKWQLARDKSVEIIDKSPHTLLENYGDVFDPENPYNQEIIWFVDFVQDVNPAGFPTIFQPRLQDEPKNSKDKKALKSALEANNESFAGNGTASPKCGFVDDFPKNDLRRPWNIIESYHGIELNHPYMPKMWSIDPVNSPRNNSGHNFIVFRLADVYLMAAEAENELSGPSTAYKYINKVRERAYEPDQPLVGLSQQEFREAMYDERRWELAGEFHRRMDLIRWGILLKVVKKTRNCAYDPASNIQPYHVLFPIPEEELQLNPALLESDPTNNGYR